MHYDQYGNRKTELGRVTIEKDTVWSGEERKGEAQVG